MTDSLPAIEEKSQVVKSESPATSLKSRTVVVLACVCCFAIALTAALLQNLRPQALAMASMFDSATYLMSSKYVLDAARQLAGHEISLLTAAKSLSETLMLNGPALPGLGAAFFWVIGKEPNLMDMRAPVVLQAIIHAFTAVLLALAGWRFTGGRLIGLTAGVLLAVWPAAVAGAARFLTETISLFFITAGILAVSYLPKARSVDHSFANAVLVISAPAAFAFGCFTALLVLTKAALLPGALLETGAVFTILLLSRIEKRSFAAALLAFLVGLFLFIAPWLLFTKAATGDYCLVPQRKPTFNLAAGLSPETDGWSAFPETLLVYLFSEADGPQATVSAFYQMNPGDFFGRMLRKPARLFQYPWNDFKTVVLGLPLAAQVVLHQFLILFGFFGLLAFCALPIERTQASSESESSESPGDNLQDVESQSNKNACPDVLSIVTPSAGGTSVVAPPRAASLTLASAPPEKLSALLIGFACLTIIAGHLAYLAFVSEVRYGFTAITGFILFAYWCTAGALQKQIGTWKFVRLCIAASLIMLAFSFESNAWRSLFATSAQEVFAAPLAVGIALFFIGCLMAVSTLLGAGKSNAPSKVLTFMVSFVLMSLSLAAFLCGRDNTYDWEERLSAQRECERQLKLPPSQLANALVLFNLRGDWRAAQLKVNGEEIAGAPISIIHLLASPLMSDSYRVFGKVLRRGTSGLEQWRAFVVPAKVLRPGKDNTISLTAAADSPFAASLTGSTTGSAFQKYGASNPVFAPGLNLFSPTKLLNNPVCFDPRLKDILPASVREGISYRKDKAGTKDQDLSGIPGAQHGQYHLFLLTDGQDEHSKSKAGSKAESDRSPIYIDVHSPRQKMGSRKERESRSIFYGEAEIPASALTQSHVRLKLTGTAESEALLHVKFWLDDGRLFGGPVELATFPHSIGGKGRRPFSFEALAQSNTIDAQTAKAMIKISSNLVPLSISNLRLEVEPLAAPALTISAKRWF